MNIGLYGGTFSPPHSAHVRAAKLFFEKAELQMLCVMPAGIPPHKIADEWGSSEHRLEMCRLAFGEFAKVSDYEIKKEGKSYTVETLRYLKSIYPFDDLYMMVGEDMFLSLDSWRAPEEIMRLCTIVAMRRNDTPESVMEKAKSDYEKRYGAVILLIEAEPFEASSTQVRELIAKGESTEELLPEAVFEYINKNNLYK